MKHLSSFFSVHENDFSSSRESEKNKFSRPIFVSSYFLDQRDEICYDER